jgi:phospholipase C
MRGPQDYKCPGPKNTKNDGYAEEYVFFSSYISDIGQGAVWADQDFKSSNHFYNPYKRKGLYGRKSAMDLGVEYYNKSIKLWKRGQFNQSLFYLGAALHIVQDMTIPQHANIRLLDNHRQYETFVKRTYQHVRDFQVGKGRIPSGFHRGIHPLQRPYRAQGA